MNTLADDSPMRVVQRHLRAVAGGDPEAMAADYAADAELDRPGRTYRGRQAILAYFRTVPGRLGGRRVKQVVDAVDERAVRVRWQIDGGPGGADRYEVVAGQIIRQQVMLDAPDF